MKTATERPGTTIALCGECARRVACGTPLSDGPTFGTPCEGEHGDAPPAATALYRGDPHVLAHNGQPLEPPRRLELVELAPVTLDASTHARQAIELLASWTEGKGAPAAAECDRFLVDRAVEIVDRVHRAVQNRRR